MDGVLLGIALGVRDVSVVGYDEWVIVGSPEGLVEGLLLGLLLGLDDGIAVGL